jgi:hypothetical protein
MDMEKHWTAYLPEAGRIRRKGEDIFIFENYFATHILSLSGFKVLMQIIKQIPVLSPLQAAFSIQACSIFFMHIKV